MTNNVSGDAASEVADGNAKLTPAERYAVVKRLFLAALDLPEAEREQWLDAATVDDPIRDEMSVAKRLVVLYGETGKPARAEEWQAIVDGRAARN